MRSATCIASSWSCVTKTVVAWDLLVQTAQPLAKLRAHPRVEGPERLVEQQHLRLDSERSGERHPLPLTAGELRRVAVRETAASWTSSSSSATRSSFSAFGRLRIVRPKATLSYTVMCLKAA